MKQTHKCLTPGPMAPHSNGTLLQGGPLQCEADRRSAACCPVSAEITAHLHRASGTAASIACFPPWHELL